MRARSAMCNPWMRARVPGFSRYTPLSCLHTTRYRRLASKRTINEMRKKRARKLRAHGAQPPPAASLPRPTRGARKARGERRGRARPSSNHDLSLLPLPYLILFLSTQHGWAPLHLHIPLSLPIRLKLARRLHLRVQEPASTRSASPSSRSLRRARRSSTSSLA